MSSYCFWSKCVLVWKKYSRNKIQLKKLWSHNKNNKEDKIYDLETKMWCYPLSRLKNIDCFPFWTLSFGFVTLFFFFLKTILVSVFVTVACSSSSISKDWSWIKPNVDIIQKVNTKIECEFKCSKQNKRDIKKVLKRDSSLCKRQKKNEQ